MCISCKADQPTQKDEAKPAAKIKNVETTAMIKSMDDLKTLLEGKFTKGEEDYQLYENGSDMILELCKGHSCVDKGKVARLEKMTQGWKIHIEGISGEMVPTWILHEKSDKLSLQVRDYDVMADEWIEKSYSYTSAR